MLTGDALYFQREFCAQVVDAGGDFLFLVKANQPTLYEEIRNLFDPPFPTLPLDDRHATRTVDHVHGLSADTRQLVASTDLTDYLDRPGAQQVFRLERSQWDAAGRHRTVQYGITSLPPAVASAARLLVLRRSHWTIENRVFYVKEVSLGEDHRTLHLGSGPMILAILRDTVVNRLHAAGYHAIAARLRHYSRHPGDILALLGVEALPQNS